MDESRRRSELAAAGFRGIDYVELRWTLTLDGPGVRTLYGTFAAINRLRRPERERLLDAIEGVAVESFGGTVERQMVTALYTARRPGTGG